jgi:AAHS family 4-hydroxybenzoate transporter-like MFS transporter
LAVASTLAGLLLGGTGAGLIALAASIYPTTVRSTGIGWAMGMGRAGQICGSLGAGLLVGAGFGPAGVFYVAAIPCFIGAAGVAVLKLTTRRQKAL